MQRLLLPWSDAWALQRRRMTLETLAEIADNSGVSLSTSITHFWGDFNRAAEADDAGSCGARSHVHKTRPHRAGLPDELITA